MTPFPRMDVCEGVDQHRVGILRGATETLCHILELDNSAAPMIHVIPAMPLSFAGPAEILPAA
ncbi:MAG: hypothetical protein COB00_15650 [Alcanivorax sp.]|nr:hypothetical protein A3Q32_00855 [Alcanivorax sp. KX64203]PHS60487.1 MAG: hypothetical protein COB00_15650 [Alcanivorax sp.]